VADLKTPLREIHKDLFETAIQKADTHKTKKLRARHSSRRIIRLGASALTVVALLAFFAYQNIPNLALKRASGTIGFNARIPGYQPAGFGLSGPVNYERGRVTINFKSNSDSRAYTITQLATHNTDQSLINTFLRNRTYQTVNVNQQTGFVYDGSNMTWIRNGVWYNIEGSSFLSADQLVHIASSL
jgi:hypothetical protein